MLYLIYVYICGCVFVYTCLPLITNIIARKVEINLKQKISFTLINVIQSHDALVTKLHRASVNCDFLLYTGKCCAANNPH